MDRKEILAALQSGELDIDAASEMLASLDKPARTSALEFRVSEKGGLSLYGMGRFPVTLYREQWERLIPLVTDGTLAKALKDNSGKLKSKADSVAEKEQRKEKFAAECKANMETMTAKDYHAWYSAAKAKQ